MPAQKAHHHVNATRHLASQQGLGAFAAALALFAVLSIVAPRPAAQTEAAVTEQEAQLAIDAPWLVAVAVGDDVVVYYTTGRQITGRLVSIGSNHIRVRIATVEIEALFEDIEHLQSLGTVREQYFDRRARISDDQIDELIDLAAWLETQEEFGLALLEVRLVLKQRPRDPVALKMSERLEAIIALAKTAKPAERPRRPTSQRPDDLPDMPLLTREQVNLIRVYETDLSNAKGLKIDPQVIDRFMVEYAHETSVMPQTAEERAAFRELPPQDILSVMFRVRADDFYPLVRATEDPESMKMFAEAVQASWLTTRCSSRACHGGTDAGSLRLEFRNPGQPRVRYSNFMILERGTTSWGAPYIDYANPESSAILQMAMDPDDVLWPHPEVDGYSHFIQNRDSRIYREFIEWVNAMYQPRPEYPFEYPLAPEPAPEADANPPAPAPAATNPQEPASP